MELVARLRLLAVTAKPNHVAVSQSSRSLVASATKEFVGREVEIDLANKVSCKFCNYSQL